MVYARMVTKKNIVCILFFALFLYTHMTVLSITDSFVTTLKGLDESLILHYSPALTRILGFVSFPVSRRLTESEKIRRFLLMVFTSLFFISSLVLIFISNGRGSGLPESMMITAVYMLSFSIGHLGGLVYYLMAMALVMHPMRGRITGMACTLATVIQLLSARYASKALQLITVTILFILLAHLTVKPPADYILEDALPFTGKDEDFSRSVKHQLIMAASAVIISVLIACRIDIVFSTMSFSGDVNLYSFSRLFMIPGYLIMGFVADSRNRRLFSAAFFVGILSSILFVVMPFYDSGYYFFLAAYYFYIGFYVFYFTYSFMELAPRTERPELWASFGRSFSDLVTAAGVALLLNTGLKDMSVLGMILLHFILLAAIFLILTLGSSAISKDERNNKGNDLLSTEDRLDTYLDSKPLTPREKEVAKYLIETEFTMKEIAANLYISERSVYRYSSSIYEKTGVIGRKELLRKYLENG